MLVLAHRGATERARENTLAAFAHAMQLGVDGVELDVRAGADGSLVVHHDPVLPDGRLIAEVISAELPADVPLLEAVLEVCAPLPLVNVEIKNLPHEPGFDAEGALAREVVAAVAPRGERVVVSSFHLPTLEVVAGQVPTAWLTLAGWDQARALRGAREAGLDGLHPQDRAVTEALVADAHALGLAMRVWTVDDEARVRELAGWGADAVVTDRPAEALAALAR